MQSIKQTALARILEEEARFEEQQRSLRARRAFADNLPETENHSCVLKGFFLEHWLADASVSLEAPSRVAALEVLQALAPLDAVLCQSSTFFFSPESRVDRGTRGEAGPRLTPVAPVYLRVSQYREELTWWTLVGDAVTKVTVTLSSLSRAVYREHFDPIRGTAVWRFNGLPKGGTLMEVGQCNQDHGGDVLIYWPRGTSADALLNTEQVHRRTNG